MKHSRYQRSAINLSARAEGDETQVHALVAQVIASRLGKLAARAGRISGIAVSLVLAVMHNCPRRAFPPAFFQIRRASGARARGSNAITHDDGEHTVLFYTPRSYSTP